MMNPKGKGRVSSRVVKDTVQAIGDFVELHPDLPGECLESLLAYMISNSLSVTVDHLTQAHEILSQRYYAAHPEDKPAEPKMTEAEVEAALDALSADDFKRLCASDARVAAFVERPRLKI
jgi:hypothetical protein